MANTHYFLPLLQHKPNDVYYHMKSEINDIISMILIHHGRQFFTSLKTSITSVLMGEFLKFFYQWQC